MRLRRAQPERHERREQDARRVATHVRRTSLLRELLTLALVLLLVQQPTLTVAGTLRPAHTNGSSWMSALAGAHGVAVALIQLGDGLRNVWAAVSSSVSTNEAKDGRAVEAAAPTAPPITDAAVSRRRPTLNTGRIDGSLRVFTGEAFNVNGGFQLTSDLYVAGSPNITTNGGASHGGTTDDGGSASPSGYQIILNGAKLPGRIHTRADAPALPADIPSSVPAPTGTRTVNINSSADTAAIGDWKTVRDLNVNKANVSIDVPPGNYGTFTLNAASRLNFTTGTYNFAGTVNLNGGTTVQATGGVTINVKQNLNVNGGSLVAGAYTSPGDIRLNVLGATLTLNGASRVNALVRAANATVTLNGTAQVRGQVIANYLNVNGGSIDGAVWPVVGDAATTVFGPRRFDRTTGQPNSYVEQFSLPPGDSAPCRLHVQNGAADGAARISSADIGLNGAAVFGPSDFNQNVATLDRNVTLTATNRLDVTLRSSPGAYLVITISCGGAQPDTTPPAVAIVTPQTGAETYSPTVSVTGTATDDGLNATGVRQVVVNGRPASYDSNTHQWTADGVPLAFGDNAINVVALDGAPSPNQGRATVHVMRLRLPSPTLTINNPLNGAVLSASTSTVAGNVSSPAPEPVGVTVNGQPAVVVGDQFTHAVTLAEGSNVIAVVATDSQGQQTQSSVSVVRDQASPSVAFSSAPVYVQPGGSYQVTVEAADNVGVADVELRVSGARVGVVTVAPYQFTVNVPAALAAGNVLTLTAVARDLTGSTAVATAKMQTTGPGGVSGYVFDDSTGYVLEGVTALLDNSASNASDAQGAFNFVSTTPSGVVRLSKAGFTPVERVYTVLPGEGAALFDARLTPLDSQANDLGPAGGTATGDGGRLRVSFGAGLFADTTDVRITSVSPQGLEGLLPFGWSPVPHAVVHVGAATADAPLPATFQTPARLSIARTPELSSAVPLVLARYDERVHGWTVVLTNLNAGVDGALEADLPGPGQYALLVADVGTSAPPAPVAGQALPSGRAAESAALDSATAAAVPSPRTAAYAPSARSTISFVADSATRLPSGVFVEVTYDETYNLLGGREALLVDRPAQDIVLYAYPAASAERPNRLGAFFVAKPTRTEFNVTELLGANVHVEIRAGRQVKLGTLVGGDGGELRAGSGAALLIPSGALAEPQPVFFGDIKPEIAGLQLPQGYEILAAFELNLTGATLGRGAVLSLPSFTGDLSRVVVARVITVAGRRSPKLVARAAEENGKLVSTINAPQGVTLGGMTTSGRYLLIRVAEPFGYVKGLVRDGATGGAAGTVRVSAERTPFVDLTGSDGRYVVLGSAGPEAAGANQVEAAAVTTDATGRGAVALGAQDAVADLPLTLATTSLTVESVTPSNGASNMVVTAPVTVTFNKPVTPASITPSSFRLTTAAGHPVPGALTVLAGSRVAVLTPAANLTGATSYRVTVAQSVRDLYGKPLAAAFTSTFETSAAVRPDDRLSAEKIEIGYPDTSGIARIAIPAGAVPEGSVVIAVNNASGATASTVAGTAAFEFIIQAQVGDEIAITVRQPDGTEYNVTQGAYRRADGYHSVGASGGTLTSDDGKSVLVVPAGAVSGLAHFKLTPKGESDMPVARVNEMSPENAPFGAGVLIESQGDFVVQKELHVELPAPAGVTEGQRVAFLKPGRLAVEETEFDVWEMVTSGVVAGGRFKTTSPPFNGVVPVKGRADLLFCVTPGRYRAITGRVTEAVTGDVSKPLGNVVLTISGRTLGREPAQIVTRSNDDGTFALLNFGIASSDTIEVVAFDRARSRTKTATTSPLYSSTTPLGPGLLGFTSIFVNVEFPSSLDDPALRPAQIFFEARRDDVPSNAPDSLKDFGLVPVGTTVVVYASISSPVDEFAGKLYVNNAEGEKLVWETVPPPPSFPNFFVKRTIFIAGAEGRYSVYVETRTKKGLDSSRATNTFNFISLRNPNTRPPLAGPPSVLTVTPADKASEVDAGTKIHLEFSEPVRNLVPGSTVYVEDAGKRLPGGRIISGGIPVDPSADAPAVSSIDFIPVPGLEGGKEYEVHVTDGVVDSDGHALDQQQGATGTPVHFVSRFKTFGGTVLTDNTLQDNAYRIAAAGQFAATIVSPGANVSYMKVYDMANPLKPALLSTTFVPQRAIGIAMTEVDPNAPDDAFKVNFSRTSYSRIAVVTTNPIPDLTRWTSLWILSLEDPAQPEIIGVCSLALPNQVSAIPGAVTIHRKRAYVGNSTHGGVFVVDIEKAINEWARAKRDNVNNLAQLNPQVRAVSPHQGFAQEARVQSAPYSATDGTGPADSKPSPVFSLSVVEQVVQKETFGPLPVKMPVAYVAAPAVTWLSTPAAALVSYGFDSSRDGANGFFGATPGIDGRVLAVRPVQPQENVLDVRAVPGLTRGGQSADLALVLGPRRIWAFDVTNAGNPVQYPSRSFEELGVFAGNARRMEVEGTLAYVIFTDRVVVFDFGDPEHPARVATIEGLGDDMRWVTVKDGFVYTLGAGGAAANGRLNVSIARTASQVLVHGYVANANELCANPVVISRATRKMLQPAEVYFQVFGHEVPQAAKVVVYREQTDADGTIMREPVTTLPATIHDLNANNPNAAGSDHRVIVGTALWNDPTFVVDRTAVYTAEVVLDEGTPTEYRAAPEPVPFSFLISEARSSFGVRALGAKGAKGLYSYVLGGNSKVELLVNGQNILSDANDPVTRSYGLNTDLVDNVPLLLDGVYEFTFKATLEGTAVVDEVVGEMLVADNPPDIRLPGGSVVNNVELSRGNLALSYTDLAVNGRGLSLGLSRTYNKAAANVYGPFGYGWQHNYQTLLISQNGGKSYTMSGGDGSGQVFDETRRNPAGEMTAEDPFQGALVKNADGSFDYFTGARVRYHFPGAIEEDSHTFFNAAYMGNLEYIEDTNGNRITLRYDAEGRMTRVSDEANRALEFAYERAETPFVGVLSPASTGGLACTNRRQFTIVRNRFVKSQLGVAWRITQVRGPGGLQLDYTYDADGNLESVTRLATDSISGPALFNNTTSDNVWKYAYNPTPSGPPPAGGTRPSLTHVLKSVTAPGGAGHVTTYDYHFDLFRMPVKSVTSPEGVTNSFSYNYDGTRIEQATVKDGRNHETRYSFDRDGHATSIDGPRAAHTALTWTHKGQRETETDPLGMVTSTRYDASDNPFLQKMVGTDGVAVEVSTTFDDKYGRPETVTDDNGKTTFHTIDPNTGNVTQVKLPTGRTITFDYDAGNGDLKRTTDENGLVTTFKYDAYGNPTLVEKETVSGEQVVTRNSFDERGRLTRTESTLGPTITNTYDALDRVVKSEAVDPSGIRDPLTTTYTYFPSGRVQTVTMDGGAQKIKNTYAYDDLDRVRTLTEEVSGAGTFVRQYTYDENSNLKTETDRRGVKTTYEYDDLNFRTTTTVGGDFGPPLLLETVVPDLVGRPTRVTDLYGNVTAYTYDGLHRLVKRELPGGYTEELRYDGNGNVVSSKDRNGHETTTTYDSVNRPTEQKDPAGRVVTWVYDDATRTVKTEMSPQGLVRLTRTDSLKRPLRDELRFGTHTYVTTYTYDGRTCEVTDPRQVVTRKSLSAFGEVGDLAVPGAAPPYSTSTRYTAFGAVKSDRDANGRTTTMGLDGFNRVTSVDYQGGFQESFVYDGEGNALRHTDRRGTVTEMTYDNIGRPLTTKVPDGAVVIPFMTVSYDDADSSESMTDARNHTTVMKYDGLRRPVSVTNAEQKTRTYQYDGIYLTAESDFKGRLTRYEYDPVGRVRQMTDRDGNVVLIAHGDGDGYTRAVTDRRGNPQVKVYDQLMRLVRVDEGGQPLAAFEYDGNDNRTAMTDGRGFRTDYTYDHLNRLKTVRHPDNLRTESYDYDGVGNVLAYSDGFTTVAQTYDTLNRPQTSRDGAGNTTGFVYDGEGLLREKYEPKGNDYKTLYEYNALGSLTKVTDAKNGIWLFDYNLDQTLKSATDALSHVVTYEYDTMKRLKSAAQHNAGGNSPPTLVSTFDYDENGNRKLVIDPKGQRADITYDKLDRQQTILRSGYVGEGPQLQTFGYDAEGNLSSVDETMLGGGNPVTRRYARTYDARNRLKTATDPYGHKVAYDYDAANNLTLLTDAANKQTTYVYDPLNRIQRAILPGGPMVNYAWKPNGLPETITYGAGMQRSFAYDGANRLTSVTNTIGAQQREEYLYAYDQNSNRSGETRKFNGAAFRHADYRYDLLDRLTQVSYQDGNGLTGEYFDNADLTNPKGTRIDAQVDFSWPALSSPDPAIDSESFSVRWTGQVQPLHSETYTFYTKTDEGVRLWVNGQLLIDHWGNHTSAEDSATISLEAGKKYDLRMEFFDETGDAEARLLWSSASQEKQVIPQERLFPPAKATDYTYDAVGNRLVERGRDIDNVPVNRTHTYDDLNRLTVATGYAGGDLSYAYDDNGNLTEARQAGQVTARYEYDNRDQLRRALNNLNQEVARYDYDFERRRLSKSLPGGAELRYVYGAGEVVNEFDRAGLLLNRYDYGNVLLRGELQGEGERWYFEDGLGSVTALGLVGAQGAGVAARYEYDAWGVVVAGGGSANRIGYTGQRLDAETGLMALGEGERYYAPALGRFIQQDSWTGVVAQPQSLNRYAYVQGNPTRYVDPSGHMVETVFDVASLGIGVVSAYHDIKEGNYGMLALDVVGVAVDAVAVAIPFIPGGVGVTIRASRGVKLAVDGLQLADQTSNVIQGSFAAYDSYQSGSAGWATFHTVMAGLGVRGAHAKSSSFTDVFSGSRAPQAVLEGGAIHTSYWREERDAARSSLSWLKEKFGGSGRGGDGFAEAFEVGADGTVALNRWDGASGGSPLNIFNRADGSPPQRHTVRPKAAEQAAKDAAQQAADAHLQATAYKNIEGENSYMAEFREKTKMDIRGRQSRTEEPLRDPIYKDLEIREDNLSVEHIIPRSVIKKYEGFGRLSKEDQLRIANCKENLMALDVDVNSAKNGRLFSQIFDKTDFLYSKKARVPDDVQKRLRGLEDVARQQIKQLINQALIDAIGVRGYSWNGGSTGRRSPRRK